MIIEVARQTVADADFTDRAEFFQTNSFELTLPDRVDVVICDHVGYFGFDYGILELLADAKQRFLKPTGVIVPAQFEQEDLLADEETLTTLELGAQAPPFLSWGVEFSCARDGTLDGVAGWFNCLLANDVNMTNSPAEKKRLDRPQAFFPLHAPVKITAGELVRVTMMARH